MKPLDDEARFRAAGVLGRGLVGALFATVRRRLEGTEHLAGLRERGQAVILVCWHDQLLPLVHAHRGEGVVVLVSEHADGEYLARIVERLGYKTARGSSTRSGARGLRELVRAARAGHDVALTPDGPRGPRHRFKEGALMAARMTRHPVVPLAAAASSAWRFDSWDRFMVPRPFARVRIAYGAPRWIPRDLARDELRAEARSLERTLNRLTRRLEGDEPDSGHRGEEKPTDSPPDADTERRAATP